MALREAERVARVLDGLAHVVGQHFILDLEKVRNINGDFGKSIRGSGGGQVHYGGGLVSHTEVKRRGDRTCH